MRATFIASLLACLCACDCGRDVPLGSLNEDARADAMPMRDGMREAMPDATPDAMRPDVDVPEPDADVPDAAIDAPAPDADSPACDCGPESCGTRECGRSECGFPCGTCEAGTEYCMAGACRAGTMPGTSCEDIFDWGGWSSITYGNRGFRRCPSNPSQIEECTCGGGGSTDWVSCTGTCITPCFGEKRCGDETCSALEFCEGCAWSDDPAPTYQCRPTNAPPGGCEGRGPMVLRMLCDGDEDCGDGDACTEIVGDTTALRCDDGVRDECLSHLFNRTCTTIADCDPCATACESITFADQATRATAVGTSSCR